MSFDFDLDGLVVRFYKEGDVWVADSDDIAVTGPTFWSVWDTFAYAIQESGLYD